MTNHHDIEAERLIDLRALAAPDAIIAYGFAEHDAPLLLTTSADDAEVPSTRTGAAGEPGRPVSRTPRPYPAWIVAGDGGRTSVGELSIAHPTLQALPHGEVAIVGARCAPEERNAQVFAADGTHRRAFQLGDGIQGVQTNPSGDGEIWASYFDEGVFGAFGWGNAQPPLGASGLVCFDALGEITWRYQPPGGREAIADCYALNVASDHVWAYYYTEFALARIAPDRQVTVWDTPVRGARAIAVHGDVVLLYGGYADYHDAVWLGRVGSERTMQLARGHIVGDGHRLRPDVVVGRGRYLHLVADGHWWRVDLAQHQL